MSSTQSTKALSDCFPFQATSLITVQIGDRPRGSKSYPNSRQRLDAKCSYGFWGPLVQSSKCGLAQSLWLKHTEANDPPSPYPMGTPEPCMCYGCELWWFIPCLDCMTGNAMMLYIHTPKKSKLSRKQASLHGPEAWSEESPFNHRSRFRAVARFFKTSSSSCHL